PIFWLSQIAQINRRLRGIGSTDAPGMLSKQWRRRRGSGVELSSMEKASMMPSNSHPVTNNIPPILAQSYLETLLAGERVACRQLIEDAQTDGIEAYDLLTQLVWPTMELLQQLYREDRI